MSNKILSPEELNILVEGLQRYFAEEKESEERKNITIETTQKLEELRTENNWTTVNVRLWFCNNRTKYIN